jgi:hypothetical protein
VADAGSPGDAFDGKPGTVFRTREDPAFLEVTFDRPREVISAEGFFGGRVPHEWSLLAGDDPDSLHAVFERRGVAPDAWSRVESFSPPLRARVFRVVAKRPSDGAPVEFGEIALQSRQRPERLEVVAPSGVICPEGALVLRSRIWYDGGSISAAARGLAYETPDVSPLLLEPRGPADSNAVTAKFGRPGPAKVRAFIPGEPGFRIESPWRELDCRAEGKPDWSVGWIERLPRLAFDAPGGGLPAPGSVVTYRAHVKNYGTVDAPRVRCRWEVDGKVREITEIPPIPRLGEGTRDLKLPFDGARREVRFVVNIDGNFAETSEGNNSLAVASDALRVGFWVERPVLAWFHATQASFGDGANGFEDWAQRQVARWNRMLAGAKYPLTPEGIADRAALDLVVEVDEGALPFQGGTPVDDPDAADRTVDMQRGFPASLLEGDRYRRTGAKRDDNPLWFDGALLRALSHIRYLVDLDRLDVLRADVAVPRFDLGADEAGYVHRSTFGVMTRGLHAGGYGPHEAWSLQRIAGRRARSTNRGEPAERGEFFAELPHRCAVRVLAADGKPLDGAAVRAWRRTTTPDGRGVFSGEPVREGESSEGGGVDLSPGDRDPFFEGRREPPFDARDAVLLLSISRGDRTCWRFLEIVPFNLARWKGEEVIWFEDVPTDLPR